MDFPDISRFKPKPLISYALNEENVLEDLLISTWVGAHCIQSHFHKSSNFCAAIYPITICCRKFFDSSLMYLILGICWERKCPAIRKFMIALYPAFSSSVEIFMPFYVVPVHPEQASYGKHFSSSVEVQSDIKKTGLVPWQLQWTQASYLPKPPLTYHIISMQTEGTLLQTNDKEAR